MNSLNHKIFISCLVFALLGSIFSFFCAPKAYSYSFVVLCGVVYLLFVLLFLIKQRKKNYVDFDIFFCFTYSIVYFQYPIFMHPYGFDMFSYFGLSINDKQISSSTILALLGMLSYILGRSYNGVVEEKIMSKEFYKKNKITSGRSYFSVSIVLFTLFIISGGYQDFVNSYSGKLGVKSLLGGYFTLLFTIFILLSVIYRLLFLYNKNRILSLRKIFINGPVLLIVFSSILLLFAGSRTLPLQFILILLFLYSYLKRNINLKQILIYILIGVALMFFISISRISDGANFSDLRFITMDLVITNRNLFEALDYVDENGFTLGKTMLSPLLSAIPFLQTLVFNIFNIDKNDASSSLLFTHREFSMFDEGGYGLGTNIIADIYISFGLFGVILLMFLLGSFISYLKRHMNNNIYMFALYIIMISYSIYLVRAEFLFPIRLLVWVLTFIFVHNKIKIKN